MQNHDARIAALERAIKFLTDGSMDAALRWFRPDSSSALPGEFGRFKYPGKVYVRPNADAHRGALTAEALNSFELTNTEDVQAGVDIASSGTDCKDIIGIYPAPAGVFYPVLGRHKEGGKEYYLFEFFNHLKARGD